MDELRSTEDGAAFGFRHPLYYTQPLAVSSDDRNDRYGAFYFDSDTRHAFRPKQKDETYTGAYQNPRNIRRRVGGRTRENRFVIDNTVKTQYPTGIVVGRIIAAALLFAGFMMCVVACAYYVLTLYGVLV